MSTPHLQAGDDIGDTRSFPGPPSGFRSWDEYFLHAVHQCVKDEDLAPEFGAISSSDLPETPESSNADLPDTIQ